MICTQPSLPQETSKLIQSPKGHRRERSNNTFNQELQDRRIGFAKMVVGGGDSVGIWGSPIVLAYWRLSVLKMNIIKWTNLSIVKKRNKYGSLIH